MDLRDIRKDLFDRLEIVDARHRAAMASYDEQRSALEERRATLEAEHRETVTRIDKDREALYRMLELEDARNGEEVALIPRTRTLISLSEFLVVKVHAHGPITKDELKSEANAAGYFEDNNGRSFHTTLMNLVKHGKVTQLEDERYVFHTVSHGLFAPEREEASMQMVM